MESIEEVDAFHSIAQANACVVTYPLTDEPWGVREFHLRILMATHTASAVHSSLKRSLSVWLELWHALIGLGDTLAQAAQF